MHPPPCIDCYQSSITPTDNLSVYSCRNRASQGKIFHVSSPVAARLLLIADLQRLCCSSSSSGSARTESCSCCCSLQPGTASGGGKDRHVNSGDDQQYSWSRPYWHAPNLDYWGGKAPVGRPFHPGVSYLAVPEDIEVKHPLPDTQIAERAIATLEGFSTPGNLSDGQQFFLGVGFHRPVSDL